MRTIKKETVSVNADTQFTTAMDLGSKADTFTALFRRTGGAGAVDVTLQATIDGDATVEDQWANLAAVTGHGDNKLVEFVTDHAAVYRQYRFKVTSLGQADVDVYLAGRGL